MSLMLGTNKIASKNVTGDTLPVGSQIPFSSLTIPDNWLLCDGSAISRVDYSELFNVIGISYGAGDGTTTFNIPNKKGRTSVGYDTSQTEFDTIGETGGAKTHTLTVGEMPKIDWIIPHVAGYNDLSGTGVTDTRTTVIGYEGQATAISGLKAHNMATGNNQPHNNLPPYQTDVWIIKAKQSSGIVATVVDNLTSTSATNALSANQGKVLDAKCTDVNVVGTYGTATKFADGTMIVHFNTGNIGATTGTTYTWNFSEFGFNAGTNVSVNGQLCPYSQDDYNYRMIADYSNSNVSRTFKIFHSYGSSLNFIIDFIAIGRWKA